MDIDKLINEAQDQVKDQFDLIDKMCEMNSEKVLKAFWKNKI